MQRCKVPELPRDGACEQECDTNQAGNKKTINPPHYFGQLISIDIVPPTSWRVGGTDVLESGG